MVTDWSVDPDDWGEFLCRTFDLWYQNDLGKVFVNWFESLVGLWMGEPSQICTLAPRLRQVARSRWKGRQPLLLRPLRLPGVPAGQPADHGCRLGRRRLLRRGSGQFGCKSATRSPILPDCAPTASPATANAPRTGSSSPPDGQPGHNYLCPGMRRFFAYADPYLRQIADQVLQSRGMRLPGMSVETAMRP